MNSWQIGAILVLLFSLWLLNKAHGANYVASINIVSVPVPQVPQKPALKVVGKTIELRFQVKPRGAGLVHVWAGFGSNRRIMAQAPFKATCSKAVCAYVVKRSLQCGQKLEALVMLAWRGQHAKSFYSNAVKTCSTAAG